MGRMGNGMDGLNGQNGAWVDRWMDGRMNEHANIRSDEIDR